MDLILGEADAAIEIKASDRVGEKTRGLHLFQQENKVKKSYIVCRESLPRAVSPQITILPWQIFCEKLWAGEII